MVNSLAARSTVIGMADPMLENLMPIALKDENIGREFFMRSVFKPGKTLQQFSFNLDKDGFPSDEISALVGIAVVGRSLSFRACCSGRVILLNELSREDIHRYWIKRIDTSIQDLQIARTTFSMNGDPQLTWLRDRLRD